MFNRISSCPGAVRHLVLVVLSIVLLVNAAAFGAPDTRNFFIDSAAELFGLRSTEASAAAGSPATTLVAGDIAISGYVGNASPTLPDQFSFVLLKAIDAGTEIKFTDIGWRSDLGLFSSGLATESEVTFTAGSTLAAGTEILFDGTAATIAGGGSAGSIVYTTGAEFTSPLNFSSSGDQLLIYQGTMASPTFITGIHMNVEVILQGGINNTDSLNWDGLIIIGSPFMNGSTSSKPFSLTTATNAIWIGTIFNETSERDNARFTCGPDVSTVAQARAALNNQANWNTNNTNPPGFTLPSGCTFLAGASPTATSTSTPTATNTPAASPTVPMLITGVITYGNAIGAPNPRFVSNVNVNGLGIPDIFSTSGFPTGAYLLSGFGAGGYTVVPSKIGGVNGISSFDAGLISQHVAGPPNPQLSSSQLTAADVSGNATVTSFDAGMIAKYVAGPPYAPPGIGETSTWRFTPPSRSYTTSGIILTGEDYSAFLMGEVSGNWTNTGARPFSGPERSIAVNAPNMMTAAGSEVLIPVEVVGAANKGIIAYEFDLRYDPKVISPHAKPIDLVGTASRGLSVVVNAHQPGFLRGVVYGAMPIDRDGVLLNLRFVAVGSSGDVSSLVWERIVFNEGDPGTMATDGRIEIEW